MRTLGMTSGSDDPVGQGTESEDGHEFLGFQYQEICEECG